MRRLLVRREMDHAMKNTTLFGASSLVGIALLAGCQAAPATLDVDNAWAKSAESGMTAVFADLSNTSGDDLTVTGGSTPVASMLELHEVAGGVMQQKEGGFVVAAGATHTLMPGADHIMLIGLTEPLLAGDTVTVTLVLDNGESVEFDAEIRDYQGANEEYVGDGNQHQMGQE